MYNPDEPKSSQVTKNVLDSKISGKFKDMNILIFDLKEENSKLVKKIDKTKEKNKELLIKLKNLKKSLEDLINVNETLRKNICDLEASNKKLMRSVLIHKSKNLSAEIDFNFSENFFVSNLVIPDRHKEIQDLSLDLLSIIKTSERLQMLFKSFTSIENFQENLNKDNYFAALKVLIRFTKEIILKEESQDSIIDELKTENERIDLLKSELNKCIKQSQLTLNTPKKTLHNRVISYNAATKTIESTLRKNLRFN
jgi:hypothetical protein